MMKHNTGKRLHTAVGDRMSEQMEGVQRPPQEGVRVTWRWVGGGQKHNAVGEFCHFRNKGTQYGAGKKWTSSLAFLILTVLRLLCSAEDWQFGRTELS